MSNHLAEETQIPRWALSWRPAPSLKQGELHGSEILVIPRSSSEEILRVLKAGEGHRDGVALWIFCDDDPEAAIREGLEDFYADLKSKETPIPPPIVMSSSAFERIKGRAAPSLEREAIEKEHRSPKETLVRALNLLKMQVSLGNIDPAIVADSLDSPNMLTSVLEHHFFERNSSSEHVWLHIVELIRETANYGSEEREAS